MKDTLQALLLARWRVQHQMDQLAKDREALYAAAADGDLSYAECIRRQCLLDAEARALGHGEAMIGSEIDRIEKAQAKAIDALIDDPYVEPTGK